MREAIGICAGIALGIWTASSPAMTITGQVVDNKARPVPGAEVVVGERVWISLQDHEAQAIGPVVRTDAQGRFEVDASVTRQRDVFIVARKPGLAHAWEWLNSSLNTLTRKHFPLVLEPACVLAGQLVDADGKPVAGAQVQAMPVNTCGFSGVVDRWYVPGPTEWFAATTDTQGRFRFEQFAAEVSAALRVQAPGRSSRYVFHLHGSVHGRFQAGRTDIGLMLPREGTLQGRVVDDRGRPVSGVELTIGPGRQREEATNQYVTRKTKSDSVGAFVFAGLPEGPHSIEVRAPEERTARWTRVESKVSVKAGAVAEAAIHLSEGGILEVTALDARTRRPVAGAKLEAHGQQLPYYEFARADAQGVARVPVPAGSYGAYVFAPQYSHGQSTVQVREGQTVRREALLLLIPRVSGRVLDPKGQPAIDVGVVVHPCGDHVYTDAQGRFTAVCDERYGIKGGLATARDEKRGLAAAVLFGDPSQPIELKLGPAWTLTGRVTDPNGAGIPAVRVSLHVDVLNCLCDPGVEVLTDPAGRFEMKAIPPVRTGFGPYRISANAAGYGPADYRQIFPRGPAGTSVNLGTIRLPKADASVSGTVVDAKGMPAAGIWVGVGQQAGMTQPKRGTVTNERGEFTLTCLCPGPIFLQAGSRNSPGGAGFLKTCLPARDVKIVLGKGLSKSPESSIPDLALAGTKEEYALLRAHCPAFPWRPAWEGFAARQAVWSVKSLPWLILTDRRHAVVAAGFKLNELDKRMAEALVQWNVLPGCLSFEQIRKSQ